MGNDQRRSETQELIEALTEENKLLSRQLERERRIRLKAEQIAEQGLRNLYERQRELEFLSAITTMANEAGSTSDAMHAVLEYMCHFIGWPAAHAHILSSEGAEQSMVPSGIWYVDPGLDLSELRLATAQRCFAKGEGLPGQVWESGAPVWLKDLANSGNFPRREAGKRSGVGAAFSTPLLVGSEVAGTLEFFGPDPMPEDADLMDLMAKAGTQLGRMIERDSAKTRLASALANSEQISALLRTTIDTMMDAQAMIETVRDSSGRIVDFVCIDANRAACRVIGISREDLVGSRPLAIFPDGANSGFRQAFAHCIENGEPVALDEIHYGADLPGGLRYYDVRAVRVDAETINTTWRDVTERAIQAQTDRLMAELKSAAAYVASILPGDLDGPVQVSSRYLPSRELGGDCYDYGWIDDDHLMVYLIDVSGHGIEPSLMSISVHTMLRSRSLPTATLLEPDQVLAELNTLFEMERHGDNYLTMWYGVYQESTRTLRYASAGHPPALALVVGATGAKATRLSTQAMPVGMFGDTEFTCSTHSVPAGSQILLYSDGALELPLPPAGHWSLNEFVDLCTDLAGMPDWTLDTLIQKLRALTLGGLFEDDCSLVRLTFD